MHSWPMIVESMSATNSRFHRGSSGWTTTSTRSSDESAQRAALRSPAKLRSAASPSSIQRTNSAFGSTSRSRPSARSTSLSSRRPAAISVAIAMVSPKPPLVVIAGPTASGKSALALVLAQQNRGVIVNADSAQIYRDLPVLSAAPKAGERALTEHRLYGAQDGALPCSAAQWAAMARSEIEQIHGQGRVPILAGGTGLYLRTLLDGIAPVPAIDPEVRRQVRGAPVEENRARLQQLDPEAAARLNAGDTTRIARALEVMLSTGRTLDEAVAAGQQATRRYAKRQYTWFAHQPPAEWPRFKEALDVDRLDDALALLRPSR